MLCVIDAFARENLAIRVVRKLKATDVIDVLADPFILRGIPTRIRSWETASLPAAVGLAHRDARRSIGLPQLRMQTICVISNAIESA